MDTQKYKRQLRQYWAEYRHLAAGFAGGILLGTIAWNGALEGHFLQRSHTPETPVITQKPARTTKRAHSPERTRMLQRRAERLSRIEQSPVVQKTTVVQASNERPVITESVRNAAPVLIEEQSSSSTVSSEPDIILTIPSSAFSSSSSSSFYPSLSSSPYAASDSFPAFDRAIHPVAEIPNWGAMFTPAEWNRSYKQMSDADFVRVPGYNLSRLTVPMATLAKTRNDADSIEHITEKLYFSTRHFGAYDLDSGEFEAIHPGIDLKLPEGMPVGSVAGGRVHAVRTDTGGLGKHVIIEHRAPDGETYFSIYGHLGSVSVKAGSDVKAGQMVGTVGMTGYTSGPHLHLQIDRGEPDETNHDVYWPSSVPSRGEAGIHTINPIEFLRMY